MPKDVKAEEIWEPEVKYGLDSHGGLIIGTLSRRMVIDRKSLLELLKPVIEEHLKLKVL